MRAIVRRRYGSPDLLELQDVALPTPKDDEVLLRVHAASLNPLDWHFMRGQPYLVRAQTGMRRPRDTRLGVDVAGRVEAVGKEVRELKVGDEVFGTCDGAFAEYLCAPAASLVLKPANVTFGQASCVGVAAFTALQGLRDKGHVQPGQRVLINGAAGGVGTFAVQLAKWFGADVTGVCSTSNVDMVRSLGADQVIDYSREDFTSSGQRYELMLDMIGNHSLSDCRRALTPEGTLVLVGNTSRGLLLGPLTGILKAAVVARFVSQRLLPFLAHATRGDLVILQGLLADGTLVPVIDRTYPLSEVPEALRYLEAGHARGKVVISVGTPLS